MTPPTNGASTGATPMTAVMNDKAIAAGPGSKESRTIARETTVATLTPIACRNLASTNIETLEARLANRLATPNKANPARNTGRRPNRSQSRP